MGGIHEDRNESAGGWMSRYLELRSWLRTSSAAEKKLAAGAAIVALGLVGWALVPTGGPGGNTIAVGGSGAAGSSQTLPSASSGGSGQSSSGVSGSQGSVAAVGPSATAGSTGASSSGAQATTPAGQVPSGSRGAPATTPASTASSGCRNLTKTDTGVTATQINVADVLLVLGGAIGNSAVGAASPQVQEQMAQAVVDDINAHGGVDCRKLVVTYYQNNPIDSTSAHNICLQIQQAGIFAVLGGFFYPAGANDCLAQARIPVVASTTPPTPSEAKQYYPYLMSVESDPTQEYRNSIFGLEARGWFTAAQGFQKLAVLEDDCSPEIDQAVMNYLAQAGVPSSQIVKNEFACPSGGFASPSDMGNFATQDSLAHVTNVVEVTGGGSFKEYSSAAQSQGYKPKYLVSDYDGFMVTAVSSTGPDPHNFDGTIATTDTRFGETNTPGLSDPATQACIALFARHGMPASYVTGNYLGGGTCVLFELLAAAAAHDPGLTRAGLATGLGQLGRFNMPYPLQDSIYQAPGRITPVKITGGDFWWTVEFYSSCTCWKVIDPTEHPSY
jgi:hypothetical protein